jgi:predicted phage tail component-like protein
MYEFVDLTERGTKSTSLSIQTIFNGENIDYLLTDETGSFTTLTVSGRSNVNNRITAFEVPGSDGLLEANEYTTSEKEIVVKYKITDETNEGFRKRFDRLNQLLSGTKKELKFTDDVYVFYATLSVNDVPEENSNSLVGTLTFICSDSYKYGPEHLGILTSDAGYIDYNGTAEGKPRFTFDVLAPITHLDIVGDEGYMRIGQPYTVEQTPFEAETITLNDELTSLTGWGSATSVDEGAIAGTMAIQNGGFMAASYGSGSFWHGPSLKKSLSEQLQDFKVEFFLQQDTHLDPRTIGRVELYLLDINNSVIAKLAMVDPWAGVKSNLAEVRIGDQSKYHSMIKTSGKTDIWWNTFNGVIRLERVGKRFFAYVANITPDGKKHFRTWHTGFDDNANAYQAKVAQVQVHIGMYGTHPTQTSIAKNVKVYKINQPGASEIPYIAKAGDTIEIDFKNSLILINGEERKDLKDFGASFFGLKKGRNNLFILPEDRVETQVSWREAIK